MKNTLRVCGKFHEEMACCLKVHYIEKEHADAVCSSYTSRVLFSTMNVYFCKIHRVYHLGHNSRMANEEIIERTMKISRIFVKG